MEDGPPVFRIDVGKEKHYAQDDAQKEEILASLPPNRKAEVYRFKGLGEMTSEQLKETALDPKTRKLMRVEIEAQLEAEKVFDQLLGKDASLRYDLIMAEAGLADDLDV